MNAEWESKRKTESIQDLAYLNKKSFFLLLFTSAFRVLPSSFLLVFVLWYNRKEPSQMISQIVTRKASCAVSKELL